MTTRSRSGEGTRGLEGLAAREMAAVPIPSHYALSLSELRGEQGVRGADTSHPLSTRPDPPKFPELPELPELPDFPEHPVAAPRGAVNGWASLRGLIASTLREIASSGESWEHARLESLARRVESLRLTPTSLEPRSSNPMCAHVRMRRDEGAQWAEIAVELNALAAEDDAYRPPRASAWTRHTAARHYQRWLRGSR